MKRPSGGSARFVLLMAMMMLCLPILAQQKAPPKDSSVIKVRAIPSNTISKYKNDPDFSYDTQFKKGDGLWDRFMYWLMSMFTKIGNDKGWSLFFKILLWVLCIGAFIYAALRLSGMEKLSVFGGDKKNEGLDYLVDQDDIHAIDFGSALEKAMAEGNYRLAIRLLYLQTLRRLNDKEMIRWALNKTNDMYVHELATTAVHNDFSRLTSIYEYAWYGEMNVQQPGFKNIHEQFINFNNRL